MWFRKLTGFEETSMEVVKENLFINGEMLTSRVNGKSYQFGRLETPSLSELTERSKLKDVKTSEISVSEVIADVQKLHCDPQNKNAVFQAASQFNLLEMVSPYITPESGIDGYEFDKTQGPACAIACGAGTIYRNYFVPVNGKIGQTHDNQIDCLKDLGNAFGNTGFNLWEMRNGYALPKMSGLLEINSFLSQQKQLEIESLKGMLKVGVQWNTEVTIENNKQIVNQVYCSALPVAYTNIDWIYWERFAILILEAAYEATLHIALINFHNTGCNKVYLTLLGGGAFGNEMNWITSSIISALRKFKNTPLDVRIVSYGKSNPLISNLKAII